jgi:RND family efflux transporter MFP subunit
MAEFSAPRLLSFVFPLLAGGLLSLSAAAQAPQQAPPPVTVSHPLQKEVTEWDEFTGQFQAVDYVEIRARVSGWLNEIHFTDGQIVNKGDLLFVIDPRPYEIQLATAKAQVETANAQLDYATKDVARGAELRQKDFLAQSSYDQRLQTMRVASASLESGKAAVRDAELNLEFTRVTAPVSGRISTHQVSIGNLISGGGGTGASGTLLTSIVSLDPVWFVFDMSEGDYLAYQRAVASGKLESTRDGKVAVGVRLTDEKNWSRTGVLDFIDNQVDRGAGTIRARATFANPNYFITPGQFGRIRIPGSEPYTAMLLPDAAIVTDQSTKIVMTVTPDGTVVPKPVRPGPTIDGLRVIREGLQADDNVIINGLVRARPGGKVTPQPGEIKPETQASN